MVKLKEMKWLTNKYVSMNVRKKDFSVERKKEEKFTQMIKKELVVSFQKLADYYEPSLEHRTVHVQPKPSHFPLPKIFKS